MPALVTLQVQPIRDLAGRTKVGQAFLPVRGLLKSRCSSTAELLQTKGQTGMSVLPLVDTELRAS